VLQWVECLQKDGEILRFKSSADPAPKDSGLANNAFVLMMQTKYQKEVFGKYGHTFASLDATHNSTHYENISLFTVIVCDQWGCILQSLMSFHGVLMKSSQSSQSPHGVLMESSQSPWSSCRVLIESPWTP
jgi:hypothetical protein